MGANRTKLKNEYTERPDASLSNPRNYLNGKYPPPPPPPPVSIPPGETYDFPEHITPSLDLRLDIVVWHDLRNLYGCLNYLFRIQCPSCNSLVDRKYVRLAAGKSISRVISTQSRLVPEGVQIIRIESHPKTYLSCRVRHTKSTH